MPRWKPPWPGLPPWDAAGTRDPPGTRGPSRGRSKAATDSTGLKRREKETETKGRSRRGWEPAPDLPGRDWYAKQNQSLCAGQEGVPCCFQDPELVCQGLTSLPSASGPDSLKCGQWGPKAGRCHQCRRGSHISMQGMGQRDSNDTGTNPQSFIVPTKKLMPGNEWSPQTLQGWPRPLWPGSAWTPEVQGAGEALGARATGPGPVAGPGPGCRGSLAEGPDPGPPGRAVHLLAEGLDQRGPLGRLGESEGPRATCQ